jgi:hypothetical protein
MFSEEDRLVIISERHRRRLTQEQVSQQYGIPRAILASVELGRTVNPRGEAGEKLHRMLQEWMDESRLSTRAAEEPALYVARDSCPSCGAKVPGPNEAALFCLHCGLAFRSSRCTCGHRNQLGAMYCSACRRKL